MKKCNVDSCKNKAKGHGLCQNHLQQLRKYGRVVAYDVQYFEIKKCSCAWCDRTNENWNGKFIKYDNKTYCDKHYQQIMKHGHLLSDKTIVYNHGINDMQRGWTKENKWNKRVYDLWSHILERCYDEKSLEKRPSYKNCYVCDRWLKLSNFIEDIVKIDNYELWINSERGTYHLDKDIKVKNNKCYCLENCMFIKREINTMERHFSGRKRKDNKSGIIGISTYKGSKETTYQAEIRCFGKTKTKRFKTIEEAIVQRLLWEWMYYGENAPQKYLFKEYLFNIY